MARGAKRVERPLPPPLPPAERTVGQLVAETIKLYGRHFMNALPIGLVVAAINQLTVDASRFAVGVILIGAAPVFSAAYAYACQLEAERPPRRSWLVAIVAGSIIFVPAALLFPWFALAAVLWLGLAGLAVPAAMREGTSVAGSLRRGFELGRVDYLHAAGALATLVILFFLMRTGPRARPRVAGRQHGAHRDLPVGCGARSHALPRRRDSLRGPDGPARTSREGERAGHVAADGLRRHASG